MIELFMMVVAAVGADARCAARVGFYQPPHGVISTPHIAAQVAEIYLNSIYGADMIHRELPLKVSISREVWHVRGKDMGANFVGGVAEIDLCQSTGQVLRVVHGK
jgi:hypothetical protein